MNGAWTPACAGVTERGRGEREEQGRTCAEITTNTVMTAKNERGWIPGRMAVQWLFLCRIGGN